MVTLSAFALFAAAWLVHFAWWRIAVPADPGRALLIVFSATPSLIALVAWVAGLPPWLGLADIPAVVLFYVGATLCYLITYTGIEETSPSLTIARALESSGSRGCTRSELLFHFEQQDFVGRRIGALVRDGVLVAVVNGFALSGRGRRLAAVCRFMRGMLNVRESA